MMTCSIRRISSSHSNLRTDAVQGHCNYLPMVGRSFKLVGTPLVVPEGATEEYIRYVATSPVVSIEIVDDNLWRFRTQNSTYEFSREETDSSARLVQRLEAGEECERKRKNGLLKQVLPRKKIMTERNFSEVVPGWYSTQDLSIAEVVQVMNIRLGDTEPASGFIHGQAPKVYWQLSGDCTRRGAKPNKLDLITFLGTENPNGTVRNFSNVVPGWYRMRNGNLAEVVQIMDARLGSLIPVKGFTEGKDTAVSWLLSGDQNLLSRYTPGAWDLITFLGVGKPRATRKVTKTLSVWANVYTDGAISEGHLSRERADGASARSRIACVELTGRYEIEV